MRREALRARRRQVSRAANREAKVLLQHGAQLVARLVPLLRVHDLAFKTLAARKLWAVRLIV